ncbi:zinc metalloprotease [Actinomadura kijaniata]|uniref:zinc metalloprotease n=1 Tax=Actinomadura kijaniata TaxID=46161 RepID=UPI003F1DD8EE
MKSLAAAVLFVAALVPVAGDAARPAAGDGGCAPALARIRAEALHRGVPERNEVPAAEVPGIEAELSSLLSRLTSSPTRRERVPDRVTVPVYFHVLHDGGRGNLTDEQVRQQIAVMNAAYGGGRGGADTGVAFTLKEITRSDNADWYAQPETHEATFKSRLRRGGADTLNLYSASLGEDLLGWSTFPWKYRSDPRMDGVVIHIGAMPDGTITNYDRGYSAVHEVGHWLGLYHTFQDGCGAPGDRVADTPEERDPTNGCPDRKDTCPAPGEDPIHNFMDYAWDACMTHFTAGQGARMRQVWSAYRAR